MIQQYIRPFGQGFSAKRPRSSPGSEFGRTSRPDPVRREPVDADSPCRFSAAERYRSVRIDQHVQRFYQKYDNYRVS